MEQNKLIMRIEELEGKLKIQIDNNKILNQRNKNLQKENIEYQKKIQELIGITTKDTR